MVDTFSKYCSIVILIEGKTTVRVATVLFEGLTQMGCYKAGNHLPETIYSDNESELTSKDVKIGSILLELGTSRRKGTQLAQREQSERSKR